jgi:hypothetical protein
MPADPASPKPLLDRLGVRPDSRVAVVGVKDVDFRTELAARVGEFADEAADGPFDLVFLQADRPEDLEAADTLEPVLEPDGAVWIVHPRGSSDVPEAKVLATGLAAGLVDNKVVRFSETHTAHRFVIPRERR